MRYSCFCRRRVDKPNSAAFLPGTDILVRLESLQPHLYCSCPKFVMASKKHRYLAVDDEDTEGAEFQHRYTNPQHTLSVLTFSLGLLAVLLVGAIGGFFAGSSYSRRATEENSAVQESPIIRTVYICWSDCLLIKRSRPCHGEIHVQQGFPPTPLKADRGPVENVVPERYSRII